MRPTQMFFSLQSRLFLFSVQRRDSCDFGWDHKEVAQKNRMLNDKGVEGCLTFHALVAFLSLD